MQSYPTKRLGSLRIALFGSGARAQRWARALADYASLDSGSVARANAVVLAPGAREPLSNARRALSHGLPVLWACRELPCNGELSNLASLCPQNAFLRISEPFLYQGGFSLMRRFLGGPEPFWRPLYLRMVAKANANNGLEKAAMQAIGTVQALLEAEAVQVTAHASRQEDGEPSALFMTVRYAGGLLLECTVSSLEARDTLVVATSGRRLTLEGESLRIATNRHCSTSTARERVLTVPGVDPVAEEARQFISAVSNHDTDNSLERWLKVVALWDAARTSLSQGRAAWVKQPAVVEAGQSPAMLGEGGAGAARIASGRRLTLVAS